MTNERNPLDELRESFRAAAVRQIEREQATSSSRRPRHRRWMLGAAVTAVCASGGFAAATQLISAGSPRKDVEQRSSRYVWNGEGLIALTAKDATQQLPWGVIVYRSPSKQDCALVGQLRGNELGVIDHGKFRRFEERTGGACGPKSRIPLFFDLRYLNGRSLVFGRVRSDVATVRITHEGRSRELKRGPGGAFLFVFDAGLKSGTFKLTGLDRRHRPVQ